MTFFKTEVSTNSGPADPIGVVKELPEFNEKKALSYIQEDLLGALSDDAKREEAIELTKHNLRKIPNHIRFDTLLETIVYVNNKILKLLWEGDKPDEIKDIAGRAVVACMAEVIDTLVQPKPSNDGWGNYMFQLGNKIIHVNSKGEISSIEGVAVESGLAKSLE